MNQNIKKDLSDLTTVNEQAIDRLFDKIEWCICDYIEEAVINNENTIEIDFGFGQLEILILESEVKYRFKPTKNLAASVVKAIVEEQNPLKLTIENNLVNRLTNIYKDLL